MFAKANKDIVAGLKLYYVWVYQAYHDISAKYKRTVLGSLWISGGMVVMSVSLAILFGALFRQGIQESLPYTMAGIMVFGLISYVLNDGAEMFIHSGGIIKNHAYPFTYYAFHTICKQFFIFLHNIVVYWIATILIGAAAVPHWTIILGVLNALLFMFGWGMMFGMLASRYRDMRFLLPYIGTLLSMLTPIFWRAEHLPDNIRAIVNLNPFYQAIQLIRAPLLGQAPESNSWMIALSYTALGLMLWYFTFSAFRRRIPFWV